MVHRHQYQVECVHKAATYWLIACCAHHHQQKVKKMHTIFLIHEFVRVVSGAIVTRMVIVQANLMAKGSTKYSKMDRCELCNSCVKEVRRYHTSDSGLQGTATNKPSPIKTNNYYNPPHPLACTANHPPFNTSHTRLRQHLVNYGLLTPPTPPIQAGLQETRQPP